MKNKIEHRLNTIWRQIQKIDHDTQKRSRLYRFVHKWGFTPASHKQHELHLQWLALEKLLNPQTND